MSDWDFPEYVPVAQRRAQAAKAVARMKKAGQSVEPVLIEGRGVARSVWGKAWCANLKRYADFATRLPRGRAYVRNGAVIDLKIARGEARALVSGSSIYKVAIAIAPAAPARWAAIRRDCAGSVASLVELLQGKLSTNVMERMCRADDGLFPAPREIRMSCSCLDGADMCKHVAAALYGVGARLDDAPALLFTLRGVDADELIAAADAGAAPCSPDAASSSILASEDLGALFGLDMAPSPPAPTASLDSRAPQKAPATAPITPRAGSKRPTGGRAPRR